MKENCWYSKILLILLSLCYKSIFNLFTFFLPKHETRTILKMYQSIKMYTLSLRNVNIKTGIEQPYPNSWYLFIRATVLSSIAPAPLYCFEYKMHNLFILLTYLCLSLIKSVLLRVYMITWLNMYENCILNWYIHKVSWTCIVRTFMIRSKKW